MFMLMKMLYRNWQNGNWVLLSSLHISMLTIPSRSGQMIVNKVGEILQRIRIRSGCWLADCENHFSPGDSRSSTATAWMVLSQIWRKPIHSIEFFGSMCYVSHRSVSLGSKVYMTTPLAGSYNFQNDAYTFFLRFRPLVFIL